MRKILIGLVGKPSAGKSTLLNALCLTDAKMANYPFTTIEANRGVALVRVDCPCQTIDENCNPRTGKCINGIRYVPVDMLDVAGLVPGASEGKGMGNKFLDDLRRADALIHVVDASGKTDEEGNNVDNYDPSNDIEWLNDELNAWIYNVLFTDWIRATKTLEQDPTKVTDLIHDRLTGLGASKHTVRRALQKSDLIGENPQKWDDSQKQALTHQLRKELFPMVIAANKMDMSDADKHITQIKEKYPDLPVVPTSGLAELTLRKAEEEGIITYQLGTDNFDFIIDEPSEHKKFNVLNAIKERLLDPKETTGVTELLEYAVFNLLEMIAVFPVEDQSHLTDHDGRILPDVFLVPKGTSAKEFAGKIHSDLQDRFLHGILVTDNNKRVSADHELNHGDILKIVSSAK